MPKSKGKIRVVLADDHHMVRAGIRELLEGAGDVQVIAEAGDGEEAETAIERQRPDVAVLDIMGVNGYDLLKIAKSRNIPALMFTAHALSEKDLKKSATEGASYYAPKEEFHNIALFIADVIEAREKSRNPWIRWFERLGAFYEQKFIGSDWRQKEKEFLRSMGIPRDKL